MCTPVLVEENCQRMTNLLFLCSPCCYLVKLQVFYVCGWCRKPKPNLELVAQQVAQQLPPPPKREKPTMHVRRPERPELSGETDTSQDSHRSDNADHNEHRKRYLCIGIRDVKTVIGKSVSNW